MEYMIANGLEAKAANFAAIPQRGEEVLNRVGQMARGFHEGGLDKMIEQAAHDISDARDHLNYVARLTEQETQHVVNATDVANPIQDKIAKQAADGNYDGARFSGFNRPSDEK